MPYISKAEVLKKFKTVGIKNEVDNVRGLLHEYVRKTSKNIHQLYVANLEVNGRRSRTLEEESWARRRFIEAMNHQKELVFNRIYFSGLDVVVFVDKNSDNTAVYNLLERDEETLELLPVSLDAEQFEDFHVFYGRMCFEANPVFDQEMATWNASKLRSFLSNAFGGRRFLEEDRHIPGKIETPLRVVAYIDDVIVTDMDTIGRKKLADEFLKGRELTFRPVLGLCDEGKPLKAESTARIVHNPIRMSVDYQSVGTAYKDVDPNVWPGFVRFREWLLNDKLTPKAINRYH